MRLRLPGMLLMAAGLILATNARSETNQIRTLSLEDCITIALEHNLDLQIGRMNPEIARHDLSIAYGDYDPSFSFAATHSYELSPGGLDDQNRPFQGTESETDRITTSLGGLLPWGMTYNFGGTVSDRYGTSPTSFPDLSSPSLNTNTVYDIGTGAPIGYLYSTNFGVSIPGRISFGSASSDAGLFTLRQPLLKDFWIDATRLNIFVGKKTLRISELNLRSSIELTITAVELSYYNLILAEEQVRVQEKAVELAERLVAENRRRVEVGAMAPLEERQAESEAAARQSDLIEARENHDTRQRALKLLLSDDYSQWMNVKIQPSEALLAIPQTFNVQESWLKGWSRRADLAAQRLSLEVVLKSLEYQKNQLFPSFDLIGGLGYRGFAQEVGGSLEQVHDRDNPYYSFGGVLTFPLANTSARNAYKSQKLRKEQKELEIKRDEQQMMIGIEDAVASARSSFERVVSSRQARLFAEEALKAEEIKLEKGKSTNFEVLTLQKRLTDTRLAEIQALADYNIAISTVVAREGGMLERHKITLNFK